MSCLSYDVLKMICATSNCSQILVILCILSKKLFSGLMHEEGLEWFVIEKGFFEGKGRLVDFVAEGGSATVA